MTFKRAVLLALAAAFAPSTLAAMDYIVYIGTYTNTGSKGIYAYRFHPETGDLTPIGLEAETPNPTFLAVDPKGRRLYAVNEVQAGTVSAWTVDRSTGKLAFLNTVSSRGDGPCHLSVDKTGRALIAANYGSGSVASFSLGPDGRLGEAASFDQHTGSSKDPDRQKGPHAHCATISPNNRFAVAADLGLDKVFVYRLNPAKGTITPNSPPFATVDPGSGPRHFAFHPNNRFAYAINEMASTVAGFRYDAQTGGLQPLQTISTLPKDFHGQSSTAEIAVHPNGKFLYGSNRGHDSIALFSIDQRTGMLTFVDTTPTQGQMPRAFVLDPTGKYLFAANQKSDSVVVFRIDQSTGKLTPTGKKLALAAPVTIVFIAAK